MNHRARHRDADGESRLSAEIYARRRRALFERLPSDAAVLLGAAPAAVRSNDVEYNYRADNDLVYLTGFTEPESLCLLLPGHAEEEFVLFVRPRDPERETWTGRRAGVEGAVQNFGAQRAYPIQQLDEKIGALVSPRRQLYYRFGRDRELNERVVGWMRDWQQLRPRTGSGPTAIVDPGELIHEMRLIKSSEEIECMRRAAQIAARAHVEAMQMARPGTYEFEVEALLDSTFRRMGGAGPAYPSIVAAGDNATILHYTQNDQPIANGDLLLIDAGAEFQNYCSDITRTCPVGDTRPQQREVYEAVLRAQGAAIEAVRPGARYDEPHQRAVEVLVDELLRLGILAGEKSEILEKELYKPYYMHRTSHWLGLDVHDVGSYRDGEEVRRLEPGMVLTVEPGLYISRDRAEVAAEFRGIGVRIEDDVVVTDNGHEVLSDDVPKQWQEIEQLSGR